VVHGASIKDLLKLVYAYYIRNKNRFLPLSGLISMRTLLSASSA
jgi:hypothetical protein